MSDSACVCEERVFIPGDGMQVFERAQERERGCGGRLEPGRGRLRHRLTRTLQLPVEALHALEPGAGRLASRQRGGQEGDEERVLVTALGW